MVKKSLLDSLTNVAPYAMMWYGNALAAPENFSVDEYGRKLPNDEAQRRRLRHLLKGMTYSGSGYMATRMAFPEDFNKVEDANNVAAATQPPTMLGRIKNELISAAGIAPGLLGKFSSLNEDKSSVFLIRMALRK